MPFRVKSLLKVFLFGDNSLTLQPNYEYKQ